MSSIINHVKASILFFFSCISFANHNTVMSFAIIGDYGSNNQGEARVASLVNNYQPEFIISLGDNNYPNGCWHSIDENIGQYYSSYIGNYKGKYGQGEFDNRFFPTLGNHDWYAFDKCLHNGKLPYFDYFTLPNNQRYYDFIKGPIHFFVLDSDSHEPDGNSKSSRQYAWFKNKIENSTSTFKVVYFHHAPYSSANHGDNKTMQWDFHKLGADLVLSGHDHSYERIVRNGLTYIVNGLGGPPHLGFKVYKTKGSKLFYAKEYGFMSAEVTKDEIRLKFISEKNTIIDEFSIRKKSSN